MVCRFHVTIMANMQTIPPLTFSDRKIVFVFKNLAIILWLETNKIIALHQMGKPFLQTKVACIFYEDMLPGIGEIYYSFFLLPGIIKKPIGFEFVKY